MMKRPIAIAVAAIFLGGCATFSQDGGFDAVESTVKARTGKDARWIKSDADAESVREMVRKLLANALSVDDAVQVALLNNRGLQATYAELGIAEADLIQAGRMTNPHFAYLRTRQGGERKLEWALTFPIIDLLTMPLRTRLESSAPARVWRRPIETVSNSESGFERVHQGSAVLFLWPLRLYPGARFEVRVLQALEAR